MDINLEKYLYDKVLDIIHNWTEEGIYAISFFVHTNECNIYRNIVNFPEFSIGYNTEKDYTHTSIEEKWNFAFWRQEMYEIISADEMDDGAQFLMRWYTHNGIENIGCPENENDMYNDKMEYIGKGPSGYYELLCVVSDVAKKLQSNGIIEKNFGEIPIIVHGLEYPWYVVEATRNANPNGQAKEFLMALDNGFVDQ